MPHSTPPHRHDQLALAVALVLIVIWGGNFTLQKYLFHLITPGGFLWARYLIMPTCALLLLRWRFGHWLPPLPRKDLLQMAWLGFLGHPGLRAHFDPADLAHPGPGALEWGANGRCHAGFWRDFDVPV